MKHLTILSLLLCLLPATATHAQDRLTLAIGYYDVLDDRDGMDFRIEYRPDDQVLIENLKSWAGLEVTSTGTIWGGAGLLYDWNIAENWHLIPSAGIGLYSQGDSDVDLDFPIQLRTQIEIAHEFTNKTRLGLALSHISNAGLGDSNPGAETLSLNWGFPF